MRIVTVASQKGGAGKTTLARNLGVAVAAGGGTAALIDTDPQGSLTDWWNRRGSTSPALIRHDGDLPGLLSHLRAGGSGVVLVDTPPSGHDFLRGVIGESDLVLVPVRPSPDDLAAVGATLALLGGTPWAFVLSQVKTRTRLAQEATRVLSGIGALAPVPVADRVEYMMAAASGHGVTETDPNGPAAAEIRALHAYVLSRLEPDGVLSRLEPVGGQQVSVHPSLR